MIQPIKKLIILSLILFASISWAADTLLSIPFDGKKLELNYKRGAKKIDIELIRNGQRRSFYSESFDLSNPTNIDAHIARATSTLQAQGVSSEGIESVVTIFEEFKFVSTTNCQAIHLGEELSSDTQVIEDLVSEFDRISAGIRGEGDFERSVELFEVTVPNVGKFQLRALIDSQGHPVRLSLSQGGGSLKDFKVERNGDTFILSTQDGKQIIKIKNHEMKNELVSIYTLGRDGLETESRTHLKLDSEDKNLKATIIASSDRVARERVGAVHLTSISIEHSPVVRNAQMNLYIPSLNVDALKDQLAELPFGHQALSLNTINARVQNVYDSCLSEAFVLRRELSIISSDAQLSQNCLFRTGLEMADLSYASDEIKQRDFRKCLVESGAIIGTKEQRSFNDEYIAANDYSKLKQCEGQLVENSLRLELASLVQQSFLRQDESFAPISARITELAIQKFRECEGENCVQESINKAKAEIYKLNFIKWFNDSIANQGSKREALVKDFDTCLESNDISSCQRKLISKTISLLPSTMLQTLAREAGLGDVSFQVADKQSVNSCVEANLERIEANHFTSVDEWRYRCSFDHFKTKLPSLTSQFYEQELASYNLVSPIASVENFMQSSVSQIQTVADAKKFVEQASVMAYSTAFSTFVDQRLNSNLPTTGENAAYEVGAQEEVRDNLAAMTEPGTYDLLEGSAAYLRRALASRGVDGVKTAFNDIVMRAHTQPRMYELVSTLKDEFKDEAFEGVVTNLSNQYEDCWKGYDANSSGDVLDFGVKCDKESLAAEQFELVSEQLRNYVSRRFPLSSSEANEILSPLYYLDKCYRDGDALGEKSVEEYRNWVNACSAVSKIDIASNMFEKLQQKYNPVLTSSDKAVLDSQMACFSKPLKDLAANDVSKWFKPRFVAPDGVEQSRSVDEIFSASNALVGAGSLLSSMFPSENFDQRFKESDRSVLQGYLKDLSSIDDSKFDSLMDSLNTCAVSFNQSLATGFRTYLIASVPNLFSRLSPNLSAAQNQVLQEVIDVELAQLLLQVQAKNEYRTIAGDGPGSDIVTSEFTIQALARFIEGMGQYISQGFVFDMDGMKTELAVFKEELKDALQWVVDSDQPVPLQELGRFFSESQLADHMALAHVAKNTDENFQAFLSSMYDREVADFWQEVRDSNSGFFAWITGRDSNHLSSDQKTKLREIEAKYDSLKNLSHRMTSSYDFRRIFNVHHSEGRAALDLIMQNEFIPRVTGRVPSATNRAAVDEAIAGRVLADNTAGGFAERFVREMAQEYLTKQSRSKWGITKWLFYDTGDFDWDVLRDTPSGKKAIDYYGRYVLLPKMLGKNVSRYQENIHKTRFEALLREAQSEN